MRHPIRVFSDLHLGHPACLITHVGQLEPLIQGAGSVIFNGDTWQELINDPEEQAEKLWGELKILCENLGVDAYFLPGNHDPSAGRPYFQELFDGKIVIFHGDVVYPEVSPWSNYYLEKKEKIDELIQNELHEDLTINARYDLAHKVVQMMKPEWPVLKSQSKLQYYLNFFWPPKRLWTLLNVKFSSQGATLKFVQKYFPRARIIISGHFHLAGLRRINDRVLINSGAFMSGCRSFFCEIDSEGVRVFEAKFDNKKIFKGVKLDTIYLPHF